MRGVLWLDEIGRAPWRALLAWPSVERRRADRPLRGERPTTTDRRTCDGSGPEAGEGRPRTPGVGCAAEPERTGAAVDAGDWGAACAWIDHCQLPGRRQHRSRRPSNQPEVPDP